MAQLPPKIPNAVPQEPHRSNQNTDLHQWPGFTHIDMPPHHHEEQQNPSWVDEFMEFSTAKREAHRRSIDEEHLMSMFSNELGTSTSDHNSTNNTQKRVVEGDEEKEKVVEEAESWCKGKGVDKGRELTENGGVKGGETLVAPAVGVDHGTEEGGGVADQQTVVDPKRVKRILANRQSAQRSRVRKLQYISELERSVTTLQSEVSVLSPRVAFLDHQRMILNADNSTLKAKIAALAQDKIFKDAHQEALKREIERLRQVYYQQNMKKTEDTITPPSTSPLPSPASIQPPQLGIKDHESETLYQPKTISLNPASEIIGHTNFMS